MENKRLEGFINEIIKLSNEGKDIDKITELANEKFLCNIPQNTIITMLKNRGCTVKG
jgi:hypothetical protein